MINQYCPLEAPAVNKNSLPKNPAVGGMPANENNARVSIHARNGLVLYKTTSHQKNPNICGISIKRDTLHIPV